jgi:hypothetical protein
MVCLERARMGKEGSMRSRHRQWTFLMAAVLISAIVLLVSFGPAMALQVGEKAPDFSLPGTTAEKIGLADFVGKKPVVVFFYLYAFSNT